MIQALIFDFDGLILDTETPQLEAWQRLYARHGQQFTAQHWGKIVGSTSVVEFHPVTYLESLLGRELDRAALEAEADNEALSIIHTAAPRPGVLHYLDAADKLGLRKVIASSSPHSWVDAHIQRLGLRERFETIHCGDDVPPGRTKPHPDLYLLALHTLGLPPTAAVVFEDSPNGIRAARAAGIFAVAVPNPSTAMLPFEGESLRLSAMTDMPLEDVLRRATSQ